MKTNLFRQRRYALRMLVASGLAGFTGLGRAAGARGSAGAMIPGRGWVPAGGETCVGDGTPLQFIPKAGPDPDPLTDELEKYPKCPYCGMDRKKWHHSRHLVRYDDDLVDGTCSIHCLAVSLSLNLDRGPKAVYAADVGSPEETKPLVPADDATYLVGSRLRGTMTRKSKMAFAREDAATAAKADHGGHLAGFDEALRLAYVGMADDTAAIRKRRAERRRRRVDKR